MIAPSSVFAVPADDSKAAAIAMRDAREARALWQRCAVTRQVTARRMLAMQAQHLEEQIVRTADELIARAVRSGCGGAS